MYYKKKKIIIYTIFMCRHRQLIRFKSKFTMSIHPFSNIFKIIKI